MDPCAVPESFVRGGPALTMFWGCFFSTDEGREDPHTTISEPSLARQRDAIKMAFRWRAYDGPTECWLGSFAILRGTRPVLLKNYIFVISQGVVGDLSNIKLSIFT